MKRVLYCELYLNRRIPPWRGKWTREDPFHNMIHCMVFPYLKGLVIIKCGLFYIVDLLCIIGLLLRFIFISIQVLNKWYQSTFLGRHCGQIFFFADFFSEKKKEGHDILEIFSIFMCNICKNWFYIWVPLRKTPKLKKQNRLK